MPTILKLGGHQLQDPAFLAGMAQAIRHKAGPHIVVHGGGDEISELQHRLGIEPRYHEGLRITDGAGLRLMTMALSGLVNKRLVGCLLAAGVDALGLSGVDRAIVRARAHPDLPQSHTGVVTSVASERLQQLLELGITPVIAPLCLGEDEQEQYNVNADHVAAAVAAATQAERLFFLTDVPGVLDERGQALSELSAAAADTLLARGIIHQGMIPKVRSALSALSQGAREAIIGNLDGLRANRGTVFHNRPNPKERIGS